MGKSQIEKRHDDNRINTIMWMAAICFPMTAIMVVAAVAWCLMMAFMAFLLGPPRRYMVASHRGGFTD